MNCVDFFFTFLLLPRTIIFYASGPLLIVARIMTIVCKRARCAWSSGRTLDLRPLGPGSKPGVFMSGGLSSFVSFPGARSVAHKTLSAIT